MDEKRICGMCGTNPAIGDYCEDCQAALDRGEEWAVYYAKAKRDEENAERRELEHRAYDSAEVVSAEMTSEEVIEQVADAGAVEPFEHHLGYKIMTSEALNHVSDICDKLHARGYEGFHPNDWSKMRLRMALEVYGQGFHWDEHGGRREIHNQRDGMTLKVNQVRAMYNLPPIKPSTFRRDLKEAKKLMQLHGFTIKRRKD